MKHWVGGRGSGVGTWGLGIGMAGYRGEVAKEADTGSASSMKENYEALFIVYACA